MASPSVGLRTLWKGGEEHKLIDIVAVHGIGANPDTTWSKGGKNWLQAEDMLPQAVPHARVMRYGYESQWLGEKMISQTLPAVAENLLRFLKTEREDCPTRPIILIGHCFGGIIIEKALTSAKQLTQYQSIVDHVAGVVFIATPHKGTGSQSVAAVVADIAAYANLGQRSKLVDTLEPFSEYLNDIVSHFSRLANDIRIPLCCFFEQRTTDVSGIIRKQFSLVPNMKVMVVDEHSACLDGFERIGLGLDHFQINKFNDPNDGYYKLVQEQIRSMAVNADEVVQKRNQKFTTMFHVLRPRNLNFTGRASTLETLEYLVRNQQHGQRSIALHGLGGVGKTSIAVELAYRLKTKLHVFWARGSSEQLFKASMLSIGKKANLNVGTAIGSELFVRDWLDSDDSGRWLLIVDNVENPEHIQQYLPTARGAILFTTPDREVSESLVDTNQVIHISSMKPEEATSLFLKLGTGLPNLREPEVKDLVILLGCLPLAILQAFAYIRHHSMSVQRYARNLKDRLEAHSSRSSDLDRLLPKSSRGPHAIDKQEQSVLETWDISYKPLVEANTFAANLLQLLCLLSSNPIPRQLMLLDSLQSLGPTSDYDIDQALSLLSSLAFISVSGEDDDRSYQIHSLVILWARTKIVDGSNVPNVAFDLISKSFPTNVQNTVQERAKGAVMLAHAVSIESYCENHEESIDRDTIMTLKRKIGRYLVRIESYSDAEKHIRKCIEHWTGRPESVKSLATCYVILGSSLHGQCKFSDAIDAYDTAHRLRKDAVGEEHLSTMDILGDKAATLYSQGNLSESLSSYRIAYDSIASSPEARTKSKARLAHILNGMALVHRGLGDLESANQCYEEGLSTAVEAHGYEHPLTWNLLNGQVGMLHKLGKHQKAKDVFFKGVEAIAQEHKTELGLTDQAAKAEASLSDSHIYVFPIIRRLMGPKHGSTIDYMDYVASTLKQEGRYEEAVKWYADAYEISVEVFGLDNLATLDIAHNMSSAYREIGQYQEADQYLDLALSGSIKLLGRDHPTVLSTLSEKAYALIDQGDCSGALELLKDVHKGRVVRLGAEHEETLMTLGAMAEAQQELGQNDEALASYQAAIDGYSKKFNEKFPPLVDAQQNMAGLLIDMERDEEASVLLLKVIAGRKNKPRLLFAKSLLGRVKARNLEREKGLEMQRQALQGLREALPDEHNFVRSAVANLAESLKLNNKLEEALPHYEDQATMDVKLEGFENETTIESLLELADLLTKLKRWKQALDAYQRAKDGSTTGLGEDHPLTTRANNGYEELLKTTQAPSKVDFWPDSPSATPVMLMLIPVVVVAVAVIARAGIRTRG